MTAQRLGAGPGLHLESPYLNDGLVVAGVDEVGKGSWAGPLVVGVAVLGPKVVNGEFPDGMRDSKALTERVRERVLMVLVRRVPRGQQGGLRRRSAMS